MIDPGGNIQLDGRYYISSGKEKSGGQEKEGISELVLSNPDNRLHIPKWSFQKTESSTGLETAVSLATKEQIS